MLKKELSFPLLNQSPGWNHNFYVFAEFWKYIPHLWNCSHVYTCVCIFLCTFTFGEGEIGGRKEYMEERERESKGSRNPSTYPPRMRIVRAVFKHYSDSSSELRMIYFWYIWYCNFCSSFRELNALSTNRYYLRAYCIDDPVYARDMCFLLVNVFRAHIQVLRAASTSLA